MNLPYFFLCLSGVVLGVTVGHDPGHTLVPGAGHHGNEGGGPHGKVPVTSLLFRGDSVIAVMS